MGAAGEDGVIRAVWIPRWGVKLTVRIRSSAASPAPKVLGLMLSASLTAM